MCLRPIRAIAQEFGRPKFHPDGELELPCGKCPECISLRASDFALRTQHELGDHDDNCCLTLTYEDNKLPNLFERQREFQLFMKKLRTKSKKKILYLVSHEYGSQTQRLHHHAIIFGINFPDMKYLKTTPKGTDLYTSRELSKLWTNGWSNIGPATAQAGYYIAAYALKSTKQTKQLEDGEIIEINDTMSSSRRPAIGLNYLKRNHRQMAELGEHIPRYYKKKMDELHTKTDKQLKKLSAQQIQLLLEMQDSLVIYEQQQDPNYRSPRQKLIKYQLFRSKISQEGDFRKKHFTLADNFEYKFYKEQFNNSLTLEQM